MKRVNLCLVGYGNIGAYHALQYRSLSRVQRLVCVDGSAERQGQAVTEGYCDQVYASLGEALRQDSLDIVDVCVPTRWHYKVGMQALRAGKHVIIEKPLCATVSQAQELISVAARHGLLLMCAHVERFNPAYQAVKERVSELGRLISFSTLRLTRRPPEGSWYYHDPGCNVILDLMIHDLDLVKWISGANVVSAYALSAQTSPDSALRHHVVAVVQLDNGAIGQLEAGWTLPESYPSGIRTRMELTGEEALLIADPDAAGQVYYHRHVDNIGIHRWPTAFHQELEHFVDCVSAGTPLACQPNEALDALHIVLGVQQAVTTGRPVRIEQMGVTTI